MVTEEKKKIILISLVLSISLSCITVGTVYGVLQVKGQEFFKMSLFIHDLRPALNIHDIRVRLKNS